MALAGTQIFKGSADVQWPEKERREQQFVTDYILSKLKKYDLKITRPYTLQAGSLLHICTEITGILSPRNSLKDLISALHPTPAVCGVPENLAKTFILNNEHYDREYYTGYLGELNMNDKQTNLYVNLRCMKTEPDPVGHIRASLYIGGGITVDSIPEKEWEETVAKSNTIKRVLC
jgi:isochorismate synthase